MTDVNGLVRAGGRPAAGRLRNALDAASYASEMHERSTTILLLGLLAACSPVGNGLVDGAMDADAEDSAAGSPDAQPVDAGLDGGRPDSALLACPAAAPGCNRWVGTREGNPVGGEFGCIFWNNFVHSLVATDFEVGSSACTLMETPARGQNALMMTFDDDGFDFFGAGWCATQLAICEVPADRTAGSIVFDEATRFGDARGTFDVMVDGDRLCGCFDFTLGE